MMPFSTSFHNNPDPRSPADRTRILQVDAHAAGIRAVGVPRLTSQHADTLRPDIGRRVALSVEMPAVMVVVGWPLALCLSR